MDAYLKHNKSFLRLLEEYKKHGGLAIAFDFDDTVYDYHGKGHTYELVIELLRELQILGCTLICWTANKDHEHVEKYLTENNIPYSGINIDVIDLGWTSRKPFYNALLDDRAGLDSVYRDLKLLVEIINKENRYK